MSYMNEFYTYSCCVLRCIALQDSLGTHQLVCSSAFMYRKPPNAHGLSMLSQALQTGEMLTFIQFQLWRLISDVNFEFCLALFHAFSPQLDVVIFFFLVFQIRFYLNFMFLVCLIGQRKDINNRIITTLDFIYMKFISVVFF